MLSSTTVRATVQGSGSAGPFSFLFKIFAATDLDVQKVGATGVVTQLNYPTDYSVSGVGDAAGGTLTLAVALQGGETLSVLRATPLTQPTALRVLGTFLPNVHEDALDRLTMLVQQHDDAIQRAIRLPSHLDPGTGSMELPTPSTGQVLGFSSATALTTFTLDSSAIGVPGAGRSVATATAYLANNAVFNVKDFGASGDGLHDDTTAFRNAAIAATSASGGVIRVPASSLPYIISGAVYLSSNTTLQLDRGAHIKRQAATVFQLASPSNGNTCAGAMIVAGPSQGTAYSNSSRGSNIAIVGDGEIDGNRANNPLNAAWAGPDTSAHAIMMIGVDGVTVGSGVRVHDASMTGIYLFDCSSIQIQRVEVDHNGDATIPTAAKNGISINGLLAHTTAKRAQVSWSRIHDNVDEGIAFDFAQDVEIHHNWIYSNGDKAIEGDNFTTGAGLGNVRIHHNWCRDNVNYGMSVLNSDGQKITIESNYIAHSTFGINVGQASESDVSITHNKLEAIGGGYAAGISNNHAIITQVPGRLRIVNNSVKDCSGSGVSVQGQSWLLDISHNTFDTVAGYMIGAFIGNVALNAVQISHNIANVVNRGIFFQAGVVDKLSICHNLGDSIVDAAHDGDYVIQLGGATTSIKDLVCVGNSFSDNRGTVHTGGVLDLSALTISAVQGAIGMNLCSPCKFGLYNKVFGVGAKIAAVVCDTAQLLAQQNTWTALQQFAFFGGQGCALTTANGGSAATPLLSHRVFGDTQDRFQLLADGTPAYGTGVVVVDTTGWHRGSSAGSLTTPSDISPAGKFAHQGTQVGFYGTAPIAKQTLAAAATDAATTQALANSLRAALIALGLTS